MKTTRRDLLQKTFAFAAAGAAWPLVAPRAVLAQAAAQGAAPKTRRLVIVQLSGGNDGLNTVIPFKDARYPQYRPTLGINSANLYTLGSTNVGVQRGMTGFRDLFTAGKLAVVQGVGYPNPNRSHFESTDIWETADTQLNKYVGWAGKLLDQIHDQQGGLAQGVAVSDELPVTLYSERSFAQTIDDPANYQIKADTDKDRLLAAYRDLYTVRPAESDDLKYIRDTGSQTYTGTIAFQNAIRTYQPMANYPGNLGDRMQSIARMIVGGSPTQVYNTTLGGFDTHSNQAGGHYGLLQNLSDALTAFYTDLQGHNRHEDVTVVTFSEFGRRVMENGSRGTDHGAASVLFVLGGMVKGGLYGNYPSLSDLQDGDLKFNVDFRSVYATLVQDWMGADATTLLGADFPRLGFFG